MRSRLLAPLLLAIALLGGCADSGSENAAEPDDGAQEAAVQTLRDHLLAGDEGDCDALRKTVLVPEDVECSDVRAQRGGWSADGTDLSTAPMEAEIADTSATVTVTWADGSEESWDLESVDGTWLVVNADIGDGV